MAYTGPPPSPPLMVGQVNRLLGQVNLTVMSDWEVTGFQLEYTYAEPPAVSGGTPKLVSSWNTYGADHIAYFQAEEAVKVLMEREDMVKIGFKVQASRWVLRDSEAWMEVQSFDISRADGRQLIIRTRKNGTAR